ncbi:MAG: flagella basal body P-ring formation protein FlgA [Deltaproteobacteria bacterium]|nr:flagella basal body P-ring formation protein FlgA [Deltaproteobacteria bacterium]
MTRSPRSVLTIAALALLCVRAAAAGPLLVEGSRIELGELVPAATGALASLDLGPAPPAGVTRLLDHAEVVAKIRALGADPDELGVPRVLRVSTPAVELSAEDVAALARSSVERALAPGVTLAHLRARTKLVVPPGVSAGRVELPKAPRRSGLFQTTVSVPLLHDGEVLSRVALSATLDVAPEAARALVARGARVTLVIETGSARIGATGVALRDADLGDVADFRVERTGKLVRARVEAADRARVEAR